MDSEQLAKAWQKYIGRTVRWQCPATGPQTGIGGQGVVVSAVACRSDVTGLMLSWVRVDIRTPSGALVSREPRQLRLAPVR